MTLAEQIFRAALIVSRQNNGVITRELVRQKICVNREKWNYSYSPIFQGMRDDHPGGAPDPGPIYRNVFHRIAHGKYQLSKIGQDLARKLNFR